MNSHARKPRYLPINPRSIESFHRYTQFPCNASGPHEAMACRSPVLISTSARGWGGQGFCRLTIEHGAQILRAIWLIQQRIELVYA